MKDVTTSRQEVKSILIFRALKLGDMLCFIPTLKAIRRAYPEAHICLVSLPSMANLFERFEHYVDEFLPFPGWPGMPELSPSPQVVVDFLRTLQERQFDLALQLHGSGEISNPLVTLFSAKRTAGFYRSGAFRPEEKLFREWPEGRSEVHRCLSLLEVLGIDGINEDLEFPLHPADFILLEEELKDAGIRAERGKYLCLHPGASTESKRWSPEAFASVADHLGAQGLKLIFTGSAAEAELVEKIRSRMKYPAENVARLNLPLGPLAALIKGSMGMICNDTGVSHLTAALVIPSIVIFTETDPKRWAPLNQDLHCSLLRPSVQQVISEVDRFFLTQEVS